MHWEDSSLIFYIVFFSHKKDKVLKFYRVLLWTQVNHTNFSLAPTPDFHVSWLVGALQYKKCLEDSLWVFQKFPNTSNSKITQKQVLERVVIPIISLQGLKWKKTRRTPQLVTVTFNQRYNKQSCELVCWLDNCLTRQLKHESWQAQTHTYTKWEVNRWWDKNS